MLLGGAQLGLLVAQRSGAVMVQRVCPWVALVRVNSMRLGLGI